MRRLNGAQQPATISRLEFEFNLEHDSRRRAVAGVLASTLAYALRAMCRLKPASRIDRRALIITPGRPSNATSTGRLQRSGPAGASPETAASASRARAGSRTERFSEHHLSDRCLRDARDVVAWGLLLKEAPDCIHQDGIRWKLVVQPHDAASCFERFSEMVVEGVTPMILGWLRQRVFLSYAD